MRSPSLLDWISLPFMLTLAYLNPISRTATRVIKATWANESGEGLGKSTPREVREFLTGEIIAQVADVFRSPNKIMMVREKLAENVIMMSKYMVLILPAPTEVCETGFDWRELPGISGALGTHLEDIANHNKEIQDLKNTTEARDLQQLQKACLFSFWRFSLGVTVFDSIRIKLGDKHPDKTQDWMRPFIHAMCAWEEANYRKSIELPDILAQADDWGELA
jgi:hypothetical protein